MPLLNKKDQPIKHQDTYRTVNCIGDYEKPFTLIIQRGEDSENRIKELKLDFGGDTLPCTDFNANALCFSITALSYNLFALMRQLLPEAMAAKVVKTGRQWFVKLQTKNRQLLGQVLIALRRFDPPPI